MPVTLNQPVAGLKVGDTYAGPMEAWLLTNGYAADGDLTDKVNVTDVLPENDPTLAENREKPGDDLSVLGEELKPESSNATELPNVENAPLPLLRTTVVGAEDSDEVKEQTAALDNSVDADKVEGEPKVAKRSRKKAEAVADEGKSAHEITEPTDTDGEGQQHLGEENPTDK